MSKESKSPMIGETIKDVKHGNPMIIYFESGDKVEFEFCRIDGENTALMHYIESEKNK